MSGNSSENYLDQLLNSMNGKKSDKVSDASDDFLEQYENEMGEADDDFLANFEADFGLDDPLAPLVHAEQENKSNTEPVRTRESGRVDISQDEFALFDELDATLLGARESNEEDLAFVTPEMTDDAAEDVAADTVDSVSSAVSETEGLNAEASEADGPEIVPEAIPEEIPLSDAGEPDLAGVDGDDLLGLLSGTAGLEDIGALLSKDEDGTSVDTEDTIGEFAEKAMQEQEAAEDAALEAEEADGKKGKKNKKAKDTKEGDGGEEKEGFFKKLAHKLFDSEEDREELVLSEAGTAGASVEELSEENMQLIRELEELDEKPEAGKKGKKDKKEKKEKKPKKEKPKKEKKPKEKKPKKEKAPKEPDNSPKLPKKPVFLIFLMVASIVVMVIVLTNLSGYSAGLNSAKSNYEKGDYISAYQAIAGIDAKEKDAEFFQCVNLLAVVESEYHNYVNYSDRSELSLEAMDSLVCAAGRYDAAKKQAETLGCTGELESLGQMIATALTEKYGMDLEEALNLYKIKSRKEYTIQLHLKLRELGLE